MSLTIVDAMRSSQAPYLANVMKQIATSDEMFAILPFEPINAESFSYERELSLGAFAAIAPGGAVVESTAKTEKVTIANREFASDMYVPNFAQEGMTDRVSPVEQQTMMKLKQAGLVLAGKCITGGSISGIVTALPVSPGPYIDTLVAYSPFIRDSGRGATAAFRYTNTGTFLAFRAPDDTDYGADVACAADGTFTVFSRDKSKWVTVTLDVSDLSADTQFLATFTASNEFDGLQNQVAPGQVYDGTPTTGEVMSFGMLETIRDAVKVRGGKLVYVLNSAARRKYNALVRATNAAGPGQVELSGMQFPTFDGIPIMRNDNVPSTETGTSSGTGLTSIYCANFGFEDGVFMAAFGGPKFDVMADPRNVSVLGFRIKEIGQVEGFSKSGRRLMWFGGMACKSDLSLARARRVSLA